MSDMIIKHKMTVNGFHINSLMYPRMTSSDQTTNQTRDPRTTQNHQANTTTTTTTTYTHANMVGQGSANQETACQGQMMGENNYFQQMDYQFGHQPAVMNSNSNQLETKQPSEIARRSPPALQMAFQAVMQANQAATNQTAQNLLQSDSSSGQENSNMAHFLSGMLQERQNQLARERTRETEQRTATNFVANTQRTFTEHERVFQEQNTINEQAKNVQTQQQYSIQQILFYLQQSQVHTLNFLHANMKSKPNQGNLVHLMSPEHLRGAQIFGPASLEHIFYIFFQNKFKIISNPVKAHHQTYQQANLSKSKVIAMMLFRSHLMKRIKT